MLMLLSCKFCCLSYMTFLAAILDTVVQYLREVSVYSEKFREFKYDLTWFLRLSLLLEDALLFSKNC